MEKIFEILFYLILKVLSSSSLKKIGLMKRFMKAMDKDGRGFPYLKYKFPKISGTKIKEGIFLGRQIKRLMKDEMFEERLNYLENSAGISFKNIVKCFLRQQKV